MAARLNTIVAIAMLAQETDVLLLALAGARWQRPERPRKMFNKICFLGLHGKI
jgi:hypothetical protein